MLGYTSWHQLFVYSCYSCLFSSYMLLFSYPSVQMYIMLFSYLMSVVYLVIILCTLFICMSTSLYTHTLTGSLFDDPGFARPDIRCFLILFRCSMTPYASQEAGVSSCLILVFLSFLPSCYFLILDISDSIVIPVLYLYDIMRGCLCVILQYSWFTTIIFIITCFGLLKA